MMKTLHLGVAVYNYAFMAAATGYNHRPENSRMKYLYDFIIPIYDEEFF